MDCTQTRVMCAHTKPIDLVCTCTHSHINLNVAACASACAPNGICEIILYCANILNQCEHTIRSRIKDRTDAIERNAQERNQIYLHANACMLNSKHMDNDHQVLNQPAYIIMHIHTIDIQLHGKKPPLHTITHAQNLQNHLSTSTIIFAVDAASN